MSTALIATDFSREAEHAWRRAAIIAREAGLGGTLMHVLPDTLPPDLHLQLSSKAQEALAAVAGELQREGLRFEPRLATGEAARELARAAAQHELVIAGARGEEVLLDFGLGRTSTRLVRWSERPVLIVNGAPREPYRRVLAAVDFSAASFAAAAYATRLAPKADFTLLHAYEVPFESRLRLAGAGDEGIEDYRRQARGQAEARMREFAGRLPLPGPARHSLVRGFAPEMILQAAQREDAQLIVIGKHNAGPIERALVGSVALRVLDRAKCDVLVVPERPA